MKFRRAVSGYSAAIAMLIAAMGVGALACTKAKPADDPAAAAAAAAAAAGGRTNAFAGVNCGAVRPQDEPDLMAWDATSRAKLDRLRKQSVVAVRYEANGCDVSMEILSECIGPKNRYVYVPLTSGSGISSADTRIARDANELFAQMPLGASNVTSLLSNKQAIRTDFKLVGSLALPPGSTVTEYDLVGPECKRATHVISAVYVGGFAMAASDPRRIESLGNLLSAPPADGMTREGYSGICDQALASGTELGGCSVPLRVVLLALDGKAAPTPRCSPGYVWNGGSCALPFCAADVDAGENGCVTQPSAPSSSTSTDGDAGAPVFDQNAIERVVRQHQGNVKRTCWEGATSENMKRVTISATVTVDPKGAVINAEAQTTDFDGPSDVATVVARCVANDIRSWKFPEPESQKVLTLPFHFIRQ